MEESAPDKIEVSGSVGINSTINGIYVKRGYLHNSRVYYKQSNGLKKFFIYWYSEYSEGTNYKVIGWRIGAKLGKASCDAYNEQNVNDPSQITKAWNIWDGKNHVKDPNVSIRVVQDVEDTPEVIKKRNRIENKKKETAVAKKKEKTANRKLKTDSEMSKSKEKAIEETEKTDPMTLVHIDERLITLDPNQLNQPEQRAPNKLVPDEIKVSGRVGHNSVINGIYVKGEDLHEGRVYYKKINGLEKFIYWVEYNGSIGLWAIGKSLGNSSRFAKNYQNVNDPSQITKAWYIWDDKKFVKDPNVTICVVEEEEEDEQEKDKKIEIKHYETSFTVNDIPTLEERILNQTLGPQSRDYIDLLDQLKQNGLDHEIHAPTCVVIGDQSSGKSSLLENLSGLELPKGCNESTTKAALELELRSPNECEMEGVKVWINPDPSEKVPKDVPLHKSPLKIDEVDVAKTIDMLTQKLIGKKSVGFTKHKIVVRCVRKGLPDMTLIDLPGIIRLGEARSQKLVMDLILHYIKQEEVIIIPVVPCNVDLDTNACLNLALKYDPQGIRTRVALTKVDCIPQGEEHTWIHVIENGYSKCQNILGWNMVVNRNTKQVKEKISLNEIHEIEDEFFGTEPWNEINKKECLGINNFGSQLSLLLILRIKKFLPTIRLQIRQKMEQTKKELVIFGEEIPTKPMRQIRYCLKLTSQISEEIKQMFNENQEEVWRLIHTNFEDFRKEIEKTKGTDDLKKLKEKVEKFRGRELPLFPSYKLTKMEIKKIIAQWEGPALNLLENVVKTLHKLFLERVEMILERFPYFEAVVSEKICELISKNKSQIEKSIEVILKNHTDVPYTQNDYYTENVMKILLQHFAFPTPQEFEEKLEKQKFSVSGHSSAIDTSVATQAYREITQRMENIIKKHEFEAIFPKAHIESYVQVSYKRICDDIPHAIMGGFEKNVKNDIEDVLMNIVTEEEEDIEKLLEEKDGITARRIKLETTLKNLQKCMDILKKNALKF